MIHPKSLLIVLSVPAVLWSTGCYGGVFSRHTKLKAQEQMTWECAPKRFSKDYPDAQPVRFRYVESQRHEEVVFGKGLCDGLTAAKKAVVTVDFEAWGSEYRGLVGYNVLAVDGVKIINVGGYGTSGVTGPAGPHPLSSYFNRKRAD